MLTKSLRNSSGNKELISGKSRLLSSGRSGPEKKWLVIALRVLLLEICGHDLKYVISLTSLLERFLLCWVLLVCSPCP